MKRDKITVRPIDNVQYCEEFSEVKSKLSFVNNLNDIGLYSFDIVNIGSLVWPLEYQGAGGEVFTPMILVGDKFKEFNSDTRKAAFAHEVGHLEVFLNDGLETYLKKEPFISESNKAVKKGVSLIHVFSKNKRKRLAELTLFKSMEEVNADSFSVIAGYGEPLLNFLREEYATKSFTMPYKQVMLKRIKTLEGKFQ